MAKEIDPDSIVMDCPVCHRTIWRGDVCHHGKKPVSPVSATNAQSDKKSSKYRQHSRRGDRRTDG